jgi:hypothetical protein
LGVLEVEVAFKRKKMIIDIIPVHVLKYTAALCMIKLFSFETADYDVYSGCI